MCREHIFAPGAVGRVTKGLKTKTQWTMSNTSYKTGRCPVKYIGCETPKVNFSRNTPNDV